MLLISKTQWKTRSQMKKHYDTSRKEQECGLFVCEGAAGTFTSCESRRNQFGVTVIGAGTAPTVKKCQFSENQLSGIFALGKALGEFIDCETSGNDLGIVLKDCGTNSKVERCRIVKNQIGVYITEAAQGIFRNNILFGNKTENWHIEKNCFPLRIQNMPNE